MEILNVLLACFHKTKHKENAYCNCKHSITFKWEFLVGGKTATSTTKERTMEWNVSLAAEGWRGRKIQCKICLFSFIFITLTVPFSYNMTRVIRASLLFQMINIYGAMKFRTTSSFALAKSLGSLMILALQTTTQIHKYVTDEFNMKTEGWEAAAAAQRWTGVCWLECSSFYFLWWNCNIFYDPPSDLSVIWLNILYLDEMKE